ncbi:MAG: hypothetical protein WBD98_02240 [Acidobacteriaceae bacterium]
MTSLPEPTPASGIPAAQAPVPPPKPTSWLHYLYFLRFSLVAWCLLPLLCGLDLWHVTSNLTRAIMTLDSGWQVVNATFFIVALGMVVLITARNTARNGQARFESTCPAWLLGPLTNSKPKALWWTLAGAHVPTIVTLIYLRHTATAEEEQYPLFAAIHVWNIYVYFLFGIVAALAFWYVVSLFYYWTYRPGGKEEKDEVAALIFPEGIFGGVGRAVPPPRLRGWIDSLTRKVLSCVDPAGYAKSKAGPLWELHFLSTIALVGIFVVYLLLYPVTAPVLLRFTDKWWIAVAFLVTLVFEYSIWNAGALTEDGSHSRWALGTKLWFQWSPVVALAGYVAIVSYDLAHGTVRFEMGFPTLASLLVLANFFLWLFAGAAFFFDRFRIPVITAFLVFVFLPKWIGPYAAEFLNWIHFPWAAERLDLEHYYAVGTMQAQEVPSTPEAAVERRAADADKPYIIVTASGGGIRAAEWTATLMALLERRFASDPPLATMGYKFHDHLLLASGVSGGSVGLMPFLLEYTADPTQAFPNDKALLTRVTSAPACSDLEAVAWGLNYYDLYRLLLTVRVPVPSGLSAGGNDPDRTWALTQAMNRNLHDRHCLSDRNALAGLPPIKDGVAMTLSQGAEMLKQGQFPAFTFNTTAAETGRRFLLANYQVPAIADQADFVPADSFLQVYTQANGDKQYPDLPLATAARLSATFPAVSSATRIPAEFAAHAYHFVDGGYYDNDGTASAIEFLKSALDDPQSKVGSQGKPLKIVLFEIRDDDGLTVEDEDDLADQQANSNDERGWTQLDQLSAPLNGMWAAGHESISMRNRRELCILEKAYQDRLDIHHVVFTIPNDKDELSPLSWNLTTYQRRAIAQRAWSVETKDAMEGAIRWIVEHNGAAAGDPRDLCNVCVEGTSDLKTSVATH